MRHAVAILVCLAVFSTAAFAAVPRVLFISSYGPTFPTYLDQIQGIRSVLDPAGVLLDVEYMDSKRLYDTRHLKNFKEMLRYKFSTLPKPQVVITADDNALRFIGENRQELLPNVPLVFCGVNNEALAVESMHSQENITGVLESISTRATISLARELFPTARTVALIYDGTPSGRSDFKRVLPITRLFPWLKFERFNLARITFSELAAGLRAMPSDSIVLLLSAYRDRTGQAKSFEETLQLIRKASSCPIFHLWQHGIGQGVLGGKVVSHFKQGQLAAESALAILKGTPASALPLIQGEDANAYMFDQKELDRFQIPAEVLPEHRVVVNAVPQMPAPENQAYEFGVLGLLLVVSLGGCSMSGVRAGTCRSAWTSANRVIAPRWIFRRTA
ncbi:ABC transporter substrate-binding protein [Salidesulfovibrio onnuriiensis]|uniref:ABC transporter substrate-binding protein n=1 Tax=Salidesulfovibrio onnuriiensis TaxID=2583823 RepID=UPI0011C8D0AE|nr:ABC transporter substrate binding protein [Salidesulfovibrio onnuriiensis]